MKKNTKYFEQFEKERNSYQVQIAKLQELLKHKQFEVNQSKSEKLKVKIKEKKVK